MIDQKLRNILDIAQSKLGNWHERVQREVKVEILEDYKTASDEYVFTRESDMLILEMIAEKLVEELEALLKLESKNKKMKFPYLDEYNRCKKCFAHLAFTADLDEAEKSDLRRKIVSFFLGQTINYLLKTDIIQKIYLF